MTHLNPAVMLVWTVLSALVRHRIYVPIPLANRLYLAP